MCNQSLMKLVIPEDDEVDETKQPTTAPQIMEGDQDESLSKQEVTSGGKSFPPQSKLSFCLAFCADTYPCSHDLDFGVLQCVFCWAGEKGLPEKSTRLGERQDNVLNKWR